jgi:hypothetical protein
MKLTFEPISSLVNRRAQKLAASSRIRGFTESSEESQVMIADATGFHIYADLHLTLELSAATEESKADLYLEILEDYARIASDFSLNDPKLLIFEVQGERLHLFLNRENVSPTSLGELISFASYFTDAVFAIIKPKVEQYWDGFCMAAKAVENSRRVAAERGRKRVFFAEATEIVRTGSATINSPMSVQAFLMRADLDGFSLGVEAAFAQVLKMQSND